MLLLGDCIDKLKTLPDCSVDAVVTDPPYGLAFMGKKWDYDVPSVEVWAECLRVLKPGGHLLAFAGTRTQHRMAVRIEDAGFEIRDMIAWLYGSGFPKSLDVSKAIDKAAGHWRGRAGEVVSGNGSMSAPNYERTPKGEPVTAAAAWSGWGTALKPAMEPITVARKPLSGTVAENVLRHGTGALNIDGCRVETSENLNGGAYAKTSAKDLDAASSYAMGSSAGEFVQPAGRWPANLIHDGSDEVVGGFPSQAGGGTATRGASSRIYGGGKGFTASTGEDVGYGDSGSAARFFYCAKASKRDRDEGLDHLPEVGGGIGARHTMAGPMMANYTAKDGVSRSRSRANTHPTVKPTALMRYLCRLVTPPGGVVLDPFMGSGSTGKGAILEGFSFIGIERDPDYMQIAEARIKHATETAMNDSQTPSQLELEVASA